MTHSSSSAIHRRELPAVLNDRVRRAAVVAAVVVPRPRRDAAAGCSACAATPTIIPETATPLRRVVQTCGAGRRRGAVSWMAASRRGDDGHVDSVARVTWSIWSENTSDATGYDTQVGASSRLQGWAFRNSNDQGLGGVESCPSLLANGGERVNKDSPQHVLDRPGSDTAQIGSWIANPLPLSAFVVPEQPRPRVDGWMGTLAEALDAMWLAFISGNREKRSVEFAGCHNRWMQSLPAHGSSESSNAGNVDSLDRARRVIRRLRDATRSLPAVSASAAGNVLASGRFRFPKSALDLSQSGAMLDRSTANGLRGPRRSTALQRPDLRIVRRVEGAGRRS